MKITQSQLKKIISEEIKAIVGGPAEDDNKDKSWAEKTPGWVHGTLDVAGVLGDVVGFQGMWFDGVNAALYIAKKEWLMAALSAISILPLIGDVIGKGTKLEILLAKAGKSAKAGKKARVQKSTIGRYLAEHIPKVEKHWPKIVDKFGDEAAEKMLKALKDIV